MPEPFKPPPLESHQGAAEQFTPPPLEDKPQAQGFMDMAGRAGGRLASNLNPMPLIKAAIPEALGGGGPINAVKGAFNYTSDAIGRAKGEIGKGNYGRAIAPALGAIPIVGPMAEQFAGDIQEGNYPEALGDAASAVLPFKVPAIARGASRVAKSVLPSAERAGKALEGFTATVGKDTPVDISAATKPALRAKELSTTGSNTPKVMRDFQKDAIYPGAPPVGFGRARDFQSAAGKLSVEETKAMNGPMGRQVRQLAKALSEGNQAAADAAGVGDAYKSAMKEYRQAMTLKKAGEQTADIAKKVAITSLIGAGGYAGYKALTGE